MRGYVSAVLALLSVTIPIACANTGTPRGCAPNSTQSCSCENGDTGVQTCSADGTVFSGCDCSGGTPDGGSSSGGSSGSSGGISSSGSGGGSSGGCIDSSSSTTCTSSSQCCQSGANQVNGAICAGDNGSSVYTCHAACTSNAQCTSGCCASVNGGGAVCAAATHCTGSSSSGGGGSSSGGCEQIGQACTSSSQCCSGSTYGNTCATADGTSYSCAAVCYHSGECLSNCCLQLQNQSFGACFQYAPQGQSCLP
ncbi:MAG TPA: hypothetical protein VF765_27425 [Polyangiaceae bacterium]